jgi:hypothetical protein
MPFSEMVRNVMFSIVVVVDDLRMMAKPFWLGLLGFTENNLIIG